MAYQADFSLATRCMLCDSYIRDQNAKTLLNSIHIEGILIIWPRQMKTGRPEAKKKKKKENRTKSEKQEGNPFNSNIWGLWMAKGMGGIWIRIRKKGTATGMGMGA